MNCFKCFKRSNKNKEKNCVPESSNEEIVIAKEDFHQKSESFCIENDILDYNMGHTKRGICLIFNHFKFDNQAIGSTRFGTEADCSKLESRFGALGFKVVVHNDLTHGQIENVIKDISSQDHSQEDCFVCCILTHGLENGFVLARDREYKLFTILNSLAPNKCPTLDGKPKIFIVQACRGRKLDDGCDVTVTDSYRSHMATSLIPSNPDFLVAYSTMADHYSFRDTRSGSWFIQSLTKFMLDYYDKDMDFLSLLTIVNQFVSFHYKSKIANKQFNDKKQVLNISHTLTKRIFFKLKTP